MKNKISILIGGLLAVALIFGAWSVTTAYAQEGTPPTPTTGQPGDGKGPHGFRGLGDVELKAAADALGMTADEVSTALKDGKTLEQLAADAGVDLQTVQDAIKAAHAEEMRTQIDQAVTDGKMTQDKANWLLEGLDKGYLDGPGFGFEFGGGPHGRPGGGPAQPTPTANP
jgi:hypothetical protein